MPTPAPRLWENGEAPENMPDAADLNLDWRDSFDFLLGYSRPMILAHHNTSQTITTGATLAINFDVEILKRGGITHSTTTNNSRFTVPYTGQYSGYVYLGWLVTTTLTSKFSLRVRKNGTTTIFRSVDEGPVNLNSSELHGAFTIDLTAGDYVEMIVITAGSGSTTSVAGATRPKFAMWYSGDYA